MPTKSNFPITTIPDYEKKEEYHRSYHDALIASATWDWHGKSIEKFYEYYRGQFNPLADHNGMVVAENGMLMPGTMRFFNSISRIIKQITGEQFRRGDDFRVRPLSRAAISRKREGELNLRVDYNMAPLAIQEQQEYGMPLLQQNTPLDESAFEDNLRNYKEEGEVVFNRVLAYIQEQNRWNNQKKYLMEDATIAGRCFMRTNIDKGFHQQEYMDPRMVFFDTNCDEHMYGCTYWGHISYQPLHEVATRFNIDNKKLEELANKKGKVTGFGNIQMEASRNFNGQNYVLVMETEWLDKKRKVGTIGESKGVDHAAIRDLDIDPGTMKKKDRQRIDKERENARVKKPIDIEIVRHCITIGDEYTVSWGETKNMLRTTDDWQRTQFSISGYLPGWKFGRNTSMVEEIMPIQQLKNEAWHKLNWAMRNDKGVAWVNDVSQTPEDMEFEDQEYIAQVLGTIPVDGMKHGHPSPYNQYKEVDRSIKYTTIQAYALIFQLCDREIEQITGVSAARLGNIESSSVAVGVNERSLERSSIQTLALVIGFGEFAEEGFTKSIIHNKVIMGKNPDKYSHIVGDEGIKYIARDSEYSLDDYGAFVDMVGMSDEDRKYIREMVTFAVQNRAPLSEIYDGLSVLLEKNPTEALIKLQDRIAKQKKEAEAAQQAASQQQGQLQEQQMVNDQLKERERGEAAQQVKALDLEREGIKAQSQERIASSKNRADLFKQRIKAQNEAAKKRVTANV